MKKFTRITQWTVLSILVAAIGVWSIQGIRSASKESLRGEINSIRTELGFRLLENDSILQNWAQIRARGLAESRDNRSMVAFPPLDERYYVQRHYETSIDTDRVDGSRFFGTTAKQVIQKIVQEDPRAGEAFRDARYHDIGIGIARQKTGISSIFIIVAEKVEDPI